MISPSSSVKWFQRFAATGSFAEKPAKKLRPSPLDDHSDWLLALVAGEPDLTLAEIEARLLEERRFKTTDSSISRFFQRHGVTYKNVWPAPFASDLSRAPMISLRQRIRPRGKPPAKMEIRAFWSS